MIKITPLFSGSKGNCTLVQTQKTNILLDLGYGYKQTVAALSKFGLAPNDIRAVVISHEHGDHIAALPHWTRNLPAKIYAPSKIADLICQRSYCSDVEEITGRFEIDEITADIYECSHDAQACLGYRFTSNGVSVASVTDTGCVNDALLDFLRPCQTIQLESNHDVDMLTKGAYSYPLKRRILSDYGHLSNAQTAEVLQKLDFSNIKRIVLAHLSLENNTKEIAFDTAVKALKNCGVTEGKDVSVYVADQFNNEVCF